MGFNGIGGTELATEVRTSGCEIGCPLTSTPPSEKRHPDAMFGGIGLNLIKSNSAVLMCLAAPGCLL
jgi:hypothetical protein